MYIATLINDDALKRELVLLCDGWKGRKVTLDMINCTGCRGDGVKFYYCGDGCEIRKCAQKNGVDLCSECPQSNNCSLLNHSSTE